MPDGRRSLTRGDSGSSATSRGSATAVANTVANPAMRWMTTTSPGKKSGFDRVFLRRLALLIRIGFGSCCSRMSLRAYLCWFLTVIAALLMFATKLVIGPFIQAIVQARYPCHAVRTCV